MIPKIIHYCWLSNEIFPDTVKICLDSWKKYLPDYEIILWNYENFPRGKSTWVDQAFDNHLYAFAADYIRLHALFHYGGIYLDSDVEVKKSFNNLLKLPYFLGQENTPSGIEAATLGCEKGNLLIKDILEYFDNQSFINPDGSFNMIPLPFIIRQCIEARYNYHYITNINDFDNNISVINVFPIDWFSPKHWKTKTLTPTINTYSIHHFAGSWTEKAHQKEIPSNGVKARTNKSLLTSFKNRIAYSCKRKVITNQYFAKLFFRFYNKGIFKINQFLYIFKNDFPQICKLNQPISNCDIEFINKEQSKYKKYIKTFYPIMRIINSEIEIHITINNPYNIITKQRCLELLKNF